MGSSSGEVSGGIGDNDDGNSSNGGILSNIGDWLSTIAENIIQIPVKIGQSITSLGNSILDGLKELGSFILDGIKSIFIPDIEEINQTINELTTNFSEKTGVTALDFSSVFGKSGKSINNVFGNVNIYGIGTISSVFADFSYVNQGVEYFRPYIRGLFVLFLSFYNINQFMSFIGRGNISSVGKIVDEPRGSEKK